MSSWHRTYANQLARVGTAGRRAIAERARSARADAIIDHPCTINWLW